MMRKSGVYLVFAFTLVFLIGSSNLLFASDARGVSENEVKVSVIIDQTGPTAHMGVPYVAAVRTYFRHINDAGGINGRKIKLLVEDDRYSIPMAVAAFKKLVFRDEVLTIFACGGTGQTTALFSQIEKNKMPVITMGTSEAMTDPTRRYIFLTDNNVESMVGIVRYIAEIMKAEDARIVFVGPDIEYAKAAYMVLEKTAKEYKVARPGREIMAMDAIDATTQVLALKKQKATHVMAMTPDGPILTILRSAKRFNYWPVFFSSALLVGDETVKAAGDMAENLYSITPLASWFDDTTGVAEMKKISYKYNPNMSPPTTRYYMKGWIVSKIAHEGIRRAGKDLNAETFVNALETIKNLDMKGLTGTISYSPTNHKGNYYIRMDKADLKKGYFVPVTDWIKAR